MKKYLIETRDPEKEGGMRLHSTHAIRVHFEGCWAIFSGKGDEFLLAISAHSSESITYEEEK